MSESRNETEARKARLRIQNRRLRAEIADLKEKLATAEAEKKKAWDEGWIVGSHDTPGYRENKELRDQLEAAEAKLDEKSEADGG